MYRVFYGVFFSILLIFFSLSSFCKRNISTWIAACVAVGSRKIKWNRNVLFKWWAFRLYVFFSSPLDIGNQFRMKIYLLKCRIATVRAPLTIEKLSQLKYMIYNLFSRIQKLTALLFAHWFVVLLCLFCVWLWNVCVVVRSCMGKLSCGAWEVAGSVNAAGKGIT